MKYTLSKPRKLANGKAAPYWGVRVRMESAYEEQAAGQLYPTLGKSPKGKDTKAGTEVWMKEVQRAIEHRAHLLSMGMPVQDTRPFEDRAAEYIEWGKVQGGKKGLPWGEGHAEHVAEYLRAWKEALGLKTLSDCRQAAFDREVVKLSRTFAPNTVNHRARTLTGLCAWATRQGYLPANPLKFRSLDKTPKQERGAYTLDELKALFQAVPAARGLLYRAAYYLRLRRNELASLTVRSVLWAEGMIRLDHRSAKDRKTAMIPVPSRLMADLWSASQGKPENARLFDFSKKHAARVLHRDCARLGIPTLLNGRRRDFHSLGASTATSMDRRGVAPALASKTMRHKSWAQTENYIKLETEQVRVVTQGLEDELEHTDDTQEIEMRKSSMQDGTGSVAGLRSLTLRSSDPKSQKTVKFRQFPRDRVATAAVTFARFQEIVTHLRHALDLGGVQAAADLAAFLKLSPAERKSVLGRKAVG